MRQMRLDHRARRPGVGALWRALIALAALACPALACAGGLPGVTATHGAHGATHYAMDVQTLELIAGMVFLPALLLMATSFTRIIIVLGLLRQALGLNNIPPNQILIGIALFLTFFVMSPVWHKIETKAVAPLEQNKVSLPQAVKRGTPPLKRFMLAQTRKPTMEMFIHLNGGKTYKNRMAIPMKLVMPAFAVSELKTAFEVGFLIYLPFLVIDMAVAAILMSLGMMMLSPQTISVPFKLMLFVMAGGWSLLISTLIRSFH